MSGCRIGKVTYKHNNISVITPAKKCLGDSVVRDMHRHLDTIADMFKGEMGGLVIIGFSMDGRYARATRIHNDAFIGPTLLPSYAAEILRCDRAADVCRSVLNGDQNP